MKLILFVMDQNSHEAEGIFVPGGSWISTTGRVFWINMQDVRLL